MPLVTVDDVISDWSTSGTHDHEWICIRIPDTARSYLCPRADLPFLQLNSTGSVARVNPRFQNEHKNHHTHSDESQSDNNARHNHRLPRPQIAKRTLTSFSPSRRPDLPAHNGAARPLGHRALHPRKGWTTRRLEHVKWVRINARIGPTPTHSPSYRP